MNRSGLPERESFRDRSKVMQDSVTHLPEVISPWEVPLLVREHYHNPGGEGGYSPTLFLFLLAVKAAERLIEHQQIPVPQGQAGNLKPPELPTGKSERIFLTPAGESGHLQGSVNSHSIGSSLFFQGRSSDLILRILLAEHAGGYSFADYLPG